MGTNSTTTTSPSNTMSHNQPINNQPMEHTAQALAQYPTIKQPVLPQSVPQFGSFLVQPKIDMARSSSPTNTQSMMTMQQNLVTMIGHSPFSPFTIIKQPNAAFIPTQSIKPTPFQGQNLYVSEFHNGMPTMTTLSPAQASKSSQQYAVKPVNQLMPVFVQAPYQHQAMPCIPTVPASNSLPIRPPAHSRSPSHDAPSVKHETRKSSSSHKEKDHSESITRDSTSISDIAVALTTAMHEETDSNDKPRVDWNLLEQSADGPLSELLKAFMERHEQPANIDQNQSMMDVHSVKTLLAYAFSALSDHDSDVACLHCHEKKGSRWTDADDRAMIELLSSGHDFNDIAKKLKRTIRALKDRYCYLKKSQALDIKTSFSTATQRDHDQSRRSASSGSPSLAVSDTSSRRRKSSKRKRKHTSDDSSQSESEYSSMQKRRIAGLDTLASTASTSSSDGAPQSPSVHSDNGSHMSDGSSHGSTPGWTAEEEEQVLALLKNGASLREASALSGRSIAAIKGKMQRNKSKARVFEAETVPADHPVPAFAVMSSLPTVQAI